MIVLEVKRISDYALRFLKSECSGKIHSVYRKTINITAGKQLIAIQYPNSILSPISVILPCSLWNFNPHTGEECYFSQNNIILPELRLIITPATEIYSTKLTANNNNAGELKKKALYMLNAAGKKGFTDIFTGRTITDNILIAANTLISKAEHAINNHELNNAAGILCSLIGLGSGLTPSGDDFLCGVMAGLKFTGNKFFTVLANAVNSCLRNTNDISRAFLTCAISGEYSETVNKFFEGEETLADFLAIGHSSGIDTLCGIYFALGLNLKHITPA